jgi:6-phospho-beta-glucosidase
LNDILLALNLNPLIPPIKMRKSWREMMLANQQWLPRFAPAIASLNSEGDYGKPVDRQCR